MGFFACKFFVYILAYIFRIYTRYFLVSPLYIQYHFALENEHGPLRRLLIYRMEFF